MIRDRIMKKKKNEKHEQENSEKKKEGLTQVMMEVRVDL